MTAARVLPAPGRSRSSAMAAGLGALLTVLAWAGWSALGPGDAAVAAAGPASPASAPVRADTMARPANRIAPAAVSEAPAGVRPRQDAPAPPVVPDGFALEHGQLTAVRAPAGAAAAPVAPVAAALPPGVRAEDAAVSPTGMVAVLRAPAAAETGPPPPRPASALHSP